MVFISCSFCWLLLFSMTCLSQPQTTDGQECDHPNGRNFPERLPGEEITPPLPWPEALEQRHAIPPVDSTGRLPNRRQSATMQVQETLPKTMSETGLFAPAPAAD
jgi:hypothetical protein